MEVWCNMNKDGPWTAILVRSYEFLQQNFSRSWEQYKMGFGDPSAEYWLGKDLFRLWIRYICLMEISLGCQTKTPFPRHDINKCESYTTNNVIYHRQNGPLD